MRPYNGMVKTLNVFEAFKHSKCRVCKSYAWHLTNQKPVRATVNGVSDWHHPACQSLCREGERT